MGELSVKATERRRKRRYDIRSSLKFMVLSRGSHPLRGTGVSENMSSSGLLFHSGIALKAGAPIKIELDWPMPAPGIGTNRLWMSGRVVRASATSAAVEIGAHDFRHEDNTSPSGYLQDSKSVRPLVLVVEADPVYDAVRAALRRFQYPVVRATADAAQSILRTEQQTPTVLITDQIEKFTDFLGRVPVIHTGADAGVTSEDGTVVVKVPKPLSTRSLRAAFETAFRNAGRPEPPLPA
jgi:hypothetical protein